jgi:hypothetical protein
MATGMKVWNNDGTLKFDVTTRLTRLLGSVQTGNQAGYIDIASQGNRAFFFIVSNDSSQPTRGVPNVVLTDISASVIRMSWDFTTNVRTPCTLHYGLW